MRPYAKKVVLITAALLLLTVTTATLLWQWHGKEWLEEFLIYKVEQATHRDLVIGEFRVVFGVAPEISLSNVSLSNASWGSRPAMLTIRRVDATLELLALLTGTIRVSHVAIIDPDLLLETSKEGTPNWVFRQRMRWWQRLHRLPTLALEHFVIRDGELVYRNGQEDWRQRAQVPRLEGNGDETLGGLRINGAARLHGKDLVIAGHVGRLRDLQSLTTPYPVDLSIIGTSAIVQLKGDATNFFNKLGLRFDVALTSQNPVALAKDMGREIPDIGQLRVSAQLVSSIPFATLSLRNIDAAVGKSRFSGDMTLAESAGKPDVTGTIHAPVLDFSQLVSRKPRTKKAEPGAKLFPDTPLPFDWLASIGGELDVIVDRLVFPDNMTFYETRFRAMLDDARLMLAPVRVKLSPRSGPLAARITVDAETTESPQITFEMSGASIPLDVLLREAGPPSGIEGGDTTITIEAKARGNTVRELMAGLDGELTFVIGQTKLATGVLNLGSDILTNIIEMALPGDHGTTLVKCAVIRLPVFSGTVKIDRTIAIETDEVNIVGSGIIDLGSEEIVLFTRTQATRGIGVFLGKISNILKIDNTLANPTVNVSAKGTLREVLSLAIAGGSFLVEGLLRKSLRDRHPCQSALSETVESNQ